MDAETLLYQLFIATIMLCNSTQKLQWHLSKTIHCLCVWRHLGVDRVALLIGLGLIKVWELAIVWSRMSPLRQVGRSGSAPHVPYPPGGLSGCVPYWWQSCESGRMETGKLLRPWLATDTFTPFYWPNQSRKVRGIYSAFLSRPLESHGKKPG